MTVYTTHFYGSEPAENYRDPDEEVVHDQFDDYDEWAEAAEEERREAVRFGE